MKEPKTWMAKILESGNRLTKPREIILEVLAKSGDHPSIEDIYFKIHNSNPNIGLTTVYRTLELLFSLGIVDKFDFGEDRTRFELSQQYSKKKHHHHLVCSVCKKIIDYSDITKEEMKLCEISELALSKNYNFKIETHIIQFYGICPKCQKNDRKIK
jgi:Fur family transcriptional regulator, ferric uptake regulator